MVGGEQDCGLKGHGVHLWTMCEAVLTENWLGGKTLVKKRNKNTHKKFLFKKKKKTDSGRKAWGTIQLGPAPLRGLCYIKLLKGKASNLGYSTQQVYHLELKER